MNRWSLLKQMLPGLLPLFIFVIADELWGTEIGLYVAVGFGILELLITYIKEKKLEKFVLADIMLLVALGLISILLEKHSLLACYVKDLFREPTSSISALRNG